MRSNLRCKVVVIFRRIPTLIARAKPPREAAPVLESTIPGSVDRSDLLRVPARRGLDGAQRGYAGGGRAVCRGRGCPWDACVGQGPRLRAAVRLRALGQGVRRPCKGPRCGGPAVLGRGAGWAWGAGWPLVPDLGVAWCWALRCAGWRVELGLLGGLALVQLVGLEAHHLAVGLGVNRSGYVALQRCDLIARKNHRSLFNIAKAARIVWQHADQLRWHVLAKKLGLQRCADSWCAPGRSG